MTANKVATMERPAPATVGVAPVGTVSAAGAAAGPSNPGPAASGAPQLADMSTVKSALQNLLRTSTVSDPPGSDAGAEYADDQGNLEGAPMPPLIDVPIARHSSVRLPLPDKFKGATGESVEDAIFAFENYLTGSGIAPTQWHHHIMPLLSGPALAAWTAFARPRFARGEAVSWEDMVRVLSSSFGKSDGALLARKRLHSCIQISSVHAFVQQLRLLIAKAGDPPPADPDLVQIFWGGLKPNIQAMSRVNPKTGRFWDSFEELVSHALIVDSQPNLSRPRGQDFPPRQAPPDDHKRAPMHKPAPPPGRPDRKRDMRERDKFVPRPLFYMQGNGGRGPGGRGFGSGRGGHGGRGAKAPRLDEIQQQDVKCPRCGGIGHDALRCPSPAPRG